MKYREFLIYNWNSTISTVYNTGIYLYCKIYNPSKIWIKVIIEIQEKGEMLQWLNKYWNTIAYVM